MDGWANIGQAMGGAASGAPAQNAFNAGALQGIQQATLLEGARKARDQNLAREAITPDTLQKAMAGDPSAQATYAAAAAQAGIDPQQLAEAQLKQQQLNWGTQAMAAASQPNPNLNALNAMNMARDGKPVHLTDVADGTAFNAMVTPNSPQQTMAPTQVGLADIMLKGAQANEAGAAAGKDSAEAARATAGIGADKASNYDFVDTPNGLMRVNKLNPADSTPVTGAGGAAITRATPNAGNATVPTLDELAAIGATKIDKDSMRTVIDPIKAQAFSAWQNQQAGTDPGMRNTAYALQKFAALQRAPVGTPGAAPAAVNVTEDSGPTAENPNAPVVVGTKGTIFDPNSLAAKMAGAHAQAQAAPATPASIAASINLSNHSAPAGALGSGASPAATPSGLAAVMTAGAPAVAPTPPQSIAGAMTGKTAGAGPAPAVAKISRAPSGAYLPATKQDYDALPAGAIYIRPGETVPRTKGGA